MTGTMMRFRKSTLGRDIFADLGGWTFSIVEFVGLLVSIPVVAALLGHVGAVTVGHDIAVERFPARVATRSQLRIVFVMIVYSALGLWLLLTA